MASGYDFGEAHASVSPRRPTEFTNVRLQRKLSLSFVMLRVAIASNSSYADWN